VSVDTRPAPAGVEARPPTQLWPVNALLTALAIPSTTCGSPLGLNVVGSPDWTAVVVLAGHDEVVNWLGHIGRWDGARLAEPAPVPVADPADPPMAEALAAWMGWRLLLRYRLPDTAPAVGPPVWPPLDGSVGQAAVIPTVAGGEGHTGR
jgi:hypothetical protein